MPASITLSDDDPSQDPATSQNNPATQRNSHADPVTPQKSGGGNDAATPKSAPAGAAGARPRNVSKKAEPPTLLTDFLMGRQSPARKAAERQRRRSLEVVKAELRHEMRQQKVRQLQPPGGVKDRVKAWQKANVNATGLAGADDAATEPPDVAFNEEEDSVTEEDRVRIKLRQKRRQPSKGVISINITEEDAQEDGGHSQSPSQPPPKLRVVSDDNWMKTKKDKKFTPRKVSPNAKKSPSPSPNAIPKNFTLRSAPNPNISGKVKAWAESIEVPDSHSSSRGHRYSKSADRGTRSDGNSSVADGISDVGSSSQLTARLQRRRRSESNDGIRIKPIRRDRNRTTTESHIQKDTGPKYPDDGIRVRPTSEPPETMLSYTDLSSVVDKGNKAPVKIRVDPPESTLLTSTTTTATEETITELTSSNLTEESRQRGSERTLTIDDLNSFLETPTKQKPAKRKPSTTKPLAREPNGRPKIVVAQETKDEQGSSLSVDQTESNLSSSTASKSIADLPGDIPFGHSAFSELDLPLHGTPKSRPKRAQPGRSTSMKGISVFKKVVEEGKKIIQDMNESAKQPVANNPPSIEKWLSGTVDPFVDTPTGEAPAEEKTPKKSESDCAENKEKKRRSQEPPKPSPDTTPVKTATAVEENIVPSPSAETEKTPKPAKTVSSPTSGGLQRRRATRGSSSPLKSGGKRPFLGVLKEAFTGESTNRINLPKGYHGEEQRSDDDDEEEEEEEDWSSGYDTASDLKSSLLSDEPSSLTESLPRTNQHMPTMAGPRFRPPTKGRELSTILSGDSSIIESDMSSELSQSTLTQSNPLERKGSGLKRRLTKHSDLVSVLSLPDNANVPQGMRSSRSRPSQRRARGDTSVGVDDLLQEFREDEHVYLRELKTLVDGVVPVLLSHVIHGEGSKEPNSSLHEKKVFDHMSKSVIAMGVSLEKMKHAHGKAPLKDIRRLADWANGVVPIYHSYLSAWRLGFQDLFVNLAPKNDMDAENDSLLNAMPRNDKGDVVNEDGERVDVAHLLKRPLLRIKHMVKLLSCIDSILGTNETAQLLRDFEALQEKARRRNREELARQTDEEAAGTDTTRARDLRTLGAADNIYIDPTLQVSAKDSFSLDIVHSNGQRLECQVELVYRDRQSKPDEPGDILIREVGDGRGRRSYLLFPPVLTSDLSARTGDGNTDMVIMVRGMHLDKQWHELLTLSADDEDQILDWLDILPLTPVPPREPEPSVVGDTDDDSYTTQQNTPVGAAFNAPGSSRVPADSPTSPMSSLKRSLPARYHPRSRMPPVPPPAMAPPLSPVSEKTTTQEEFLPSDDAPTFEKSRPLHEGMRPDPNAFRKSQQQSSPPPYREDGAPPPPAHRTLSSSSDKKNDKSKLKAPEDLNSANIKRRTSSPLKHEYLPSDVSSGSETGSYTEESDSDSSDDEIESVDIPETEIGISLPKENELPVPEELPTDSVCSLAPSNSASQAGLYGHKTTPEENATRYYATISRWSEKGLWKDVSSTPFSIIVTAGLVEAYPLRDNNEDSAKSDRPHIALDLTPLVLIRQSTAVDLEIRSSLQPQSQLYSQHSGGNFRFRCHSAPECFSLYMSVHHARLNNQKFIELENEARFRSFGERKAPPQDGDSSSRRRSWFGRKNSYRSSVRAPSQDAASTTPSSNPSASSFLKRLSVAGSLSFNLARSSVDKQSGAGSNSLYTSSSSSGTPPRSPSISANNSGRTPTNLGSDNIHIRLHLLASSAKWEDFGNCSLQIRRPPPGWHQALRADHGLEKRVTVTTIPRKETDQPRIVLDAVLGSACFTPMGTRGVVCGVWEDHKGAGGVAGMVPATGPTGGNIKKWCFQFAGAMEANSVLRLVHQEVVTT